MGITKKGSVTKALMVGSAMVALSAAGAQQAQAATGTGAMTAIILTPIAVTVPTDLHFGSLTETASGTAVIAPGGARSVTGGVQPVVGAGLETNAVVSISAATGVNIVISMTAASFTVSSGGPTMAVNNFLIAGTATAATITQTIAASPTLFNVGATLNVVSPQTVGTYTGNFTVNANYQ